MLLHPKLHAQKHMIDEKGSLLPQVCRCCIHRRIEVCRDDSCEIPCADLVDPPPHRPGYLQHQLDTFWGCGVKMEKFPIADELHVRAEMQEACRRCNNAVTVT